MIYFLVSVSALIASFLTFFSGFGLGTILLPVFALYYPLAVAIGLTATVHLLNNLFKMFLLYGNIHLKTLLRFGIPSVIAALAGAYFLNVLSHSTGSVASWTFAGHTFVIRLQGILIGILVILFALAEMIPYFSEITFSKQHMVLGGALSGFFGGLTGHQGALRSAFLLKSGLPKEQFIATGVAIACLVDITRIAFYTGLSQVWTGTTHWPLLCVAIFFAWTGALLGNYLFKKTSLGFFKWFVCIFMIVMGLCMCIGVVQ